MHEVISFDVILISTYSILQNFFLKTNYLLLLNQLYAKMF